MNDKDYMLRALELARKGSGATSPNPMVGSVIVKNGRIIGEGFHRKFGEKHAEIMAIDQATSSCEGATLYCNLEPCTADIPAKKTPPCTKRIIEENIRRVVISTTDPNPFVNGKGIDLLRHKGIRVETGILADQAIILNEKYFKFMKSGLPFVHLKVAQSLDGRIATASGKSQWITNHSALKTVHQLRAEYDAVLVGINTVLQDNPRLTPRLAEGMHPYRVVLDNELSIPEQSNLLSDEYTKKTILFTRVQPHSRKFRELTGRGVKMMHQNSGSVPDIDLQEMLKELAKLHITSVLVEGGGKIFTSFIKERMFDKVTFFIAPILIGTGIESIGDLGIESLSQALKLERTTIRILDNQAVFEGYRDFTSLSPNRTEI